MLAVIRVVADRLSAVERVGVWQMGGVCAAALCREGFNPPAFWGYGWPRIWGDSMARRRKESGLDVIASMPWPLGIVLGLLAYWTIRYGLGIYFSSRGGQLLIRDLDRNHVL